ncbi:hypothetical protein HDK64DRAFT_271499 [Phyllosticta capitalensis]
MSTHDARTAREVDLLWWYFLGLSGTPLCLVYCTSISGKRLEFSVKVIGVLQYSLHHTAAVGRHMDFMRACVRREPSAAARSPARSLNTTIRILSYAHHADISKMRMITNNTIMAASRSPSPPAPDNDTSSSSNAAAPPVGLVRRLTKKLRNRNHLAAAHDTSQGDATTTTTVNKPSVDADDTSRCAHQEDIAASAPFHDDDTTTDPSHDTTAAAMFSSSSAANTVPCEHTTTYPDPAVDYAAKAREVTIAMLCDSHLSADQRTMLLEQLSQCLSWPNTHQQAAYLHKKLSDMAEELAIAMAATQNPTARRSLLHGLCMNARGMLNLFEVASVSRRDF